MRTGADQSSPTASPKVTCVVDGDTHISEGGGGNNRVVSAYADEQVWGGQYIIELDNADESLNSKDYKGEGLVLTFEFTGEEADDLPPLWVHNQQFISKEGKLLLVLNCIDAWGLLAQVSSTLANASYNQKWQQDLSDLTLPSGEAVPDALKTAIEANYGKTIFTIIGELIDTIGEAVALEDDDGIINDRSPPITISNARTGIRQLLDMTKSYLLWKTDGAFDVIQPDSHEVVYSYSTANLIFSNLEDVAVVIPNRVTFWAISEDGTDWISGSDTDAASYAKLGVYIDKHYLLGNMQIDARASEATLIALAEGALAKIQGERSIGVLVAPMHCTQELFDKITVVDDRYDTPRTTTGYVHRITREYSRGIYRITIQLGGVTTGYTPAGGGLPTPLAEAEPPLAPDHRTWFDTLPKAVQGFYHNITFAADDRDTVSWGSGTIEFYDGTTQAVASGNTGNIPDGNLRYLYFDLNDGSPNVLKVTDDYLSVMSEYTGVICVAQRGSEAGINATFLPSFGKQPLITADLIYLTGLLDRLPDGTYGKVLNASLTAEGLVLLDEVVEGTYALTLSASLTAEGLVLLSEASGDLDDIGEGSSYGRILQTIIAAGLIQVGAGTKDDDLDGFHISTTEIVGQAAGVDQVVLGTDGAIKAGAGAVVLNVDGIKIDGALLKFVNGEITVSDAGWVAALGSFAIQGDYPLYLRGGPIWFADNQEIGPRKDTAGVLYFRTRDIVGTGELYHRFSPMPVGDVYAGGLGDSTHIWTSIWGYYCYAGELRMYGNRRFGAYADAGTFTYFITRNAADDGDVSHIFAPLTNAHGYVGNASRYWYRMYADAYYGKNLNIQAFQHFDDIALVKAIGSERILDEQGQWKDVLDVDTLPEGVKHIVEVEEVEENTDIPEREGRIERAGEGEPTVRLEKFINTGALSSLAIGTLKQLIERVEAIERRL